MIEIAAQDEPTVCCAFNRANRERGCSTHHGFMDFARLVASTGERNTRNLGVMFGTAFETASYSDVLERHAQCVLDDLYHAFEMSVQLADGQLGSGYAVDYLCSSHRDPDQLRRAWGHVVIYCRSCLRASAPIALGKEENHFQPFAYFSGSSTAPQPTPTCAALEGEYIDLPAGWANVWLDENTSLMVCDICRTRRYSNASTTE